MARPRLGSCHICSAWLAIFIIAGYRGLPTFWLRYLPKLGSPPRLGCPLFARLLYDPYSGFATSFFVRFAKNPKTSCNSVSPCTLFWLFLCLTPRRIEELIKI